MSQPYVAPLLGLDGAALEAGGPEIHQQLQPLVIDGSVSQEDIARDVRRRLDRRRRFGCDELAMRQTENRSIQFGKDQPLRPVVDYVHAGDLVEQPEDASGLGGARRVVVARDDDDPRAV